MIYPVCGKEIITVAFNVIYLEFFFNLRIIVQNSFFIKTKTLEKIKKIFFIIQVKKSSQVSGLQCVRTRTQRAFRP